MTWAMAYESPVGLLGLESDEAGLRALWFEGQRPMPTGRPGAGAPGALRAATRWLDVYFSGRDPGFAVPLALAGTNFRLAVWQILLTIPYGRTMTYGEIAKMMASRGGGRPCPQAVGGAVGHNPVNIIVPCHRVVGAGGRLVGYGGGLARKAELLKREGFQGLPGSLL